MALSITGAEKLSTLPFLHEIDSLKKEKDSYEPLPKETEARILQKFRLEWNYHSNAIEGNKLTYGETVAFIMEGLTAKGKPLKDHLDIQGHDEAVKYLVSLVKDRDYLLTEADMRNLHKTILKESYWAEAITADGQPTKKEIKVGQYKSTSNSVLTPTGEMHYYAGPDETPIKMGELMEFYKEAKASASIHPLVLAALFHHEFVAIHPFDDGNGRMARLLMNLMLMQSGYPPVVVKQDDRLNYYQVLRRADAGEYIPVAEYMSDLMKHSLEVYVKGAKGESIEEESDIDKEIALFKKGLGEDKIKHKKEEGLIERALKDSIAPFFMLLFKKFEQLDSVFVEIVKSIKKDKDKTFSEFFSFEPGDINYLFSSDIFYNHPDFNLNSFSINISFRGFKKANQSMVFDLPYIINFSEFEYSIREQNNSNSILKEFYGKTLQPEIIALAVKSEVRRLLEELKRYS